MGNNSKTDDYGTFFYKLRNGNLPFEYDTKKQIQDIYKVIRKKNSDLTCGIICAIASSYLYEIFKDEKNRLLFVVTLLAIFFLLKLLFFIIELIKHGILTILQKRTSTDAYEERIKDLFFRKIIVQTTYVFSITKRCSELKTGNDKNKLQRIYAMQAIFGVRLISTDLKNIFSNKTPRKKTKIIDALGESNILHVLNILNSCLEEIKAIFQDLVIPQDNELLNQLTNTVQNPKNTELDTKGFDINWLFLEDWLK